MMKRPTLFLMLGLIVGIASGAVMTIAQELDAKGTATTRSQAPNDGTATTNDSGASDRADVAPGPGAGKDSSQSTLNLSGTVVSVSDTTLVVSTGPDAPTMTLAIDGSSRLPSHLTAGDKISVDYVTPEAGKYLAVSVTVPTAGSPSEGTPASDGSGLATDPRNGAAPGPPVGGRSPLEEPFIAIAVLAALVIGITLGVRSLRGHAVSMTHDARR